MFGTRRIGSLVLAASALAAGSLGAQTKAKTPAKAPAKAATFTVTSPTLTAQKGRIELKQVSNTFGCTGENVSPALAWTGAPAATKSFAVTVYDPDAPTGSGFWHWVVYNIPPTTMSLPEGAGDPSKALAPAGAVQGLTDYSKLGYGGPCPPTGDKPHRYIFTVYALDMAGMDLPTNATPAVVGFSMHGHTLATARLIAHYGR